MSKKSSTYCPKSGIARVLFMTALYFIGVVFAVVEPLLTQKPNIRKRI